jgi:hypothetical protein
MFGGKLDVLGPPIAETWEWDGNTWIPTFPLNIPPPRRDFSMAYDAKNHRTIIYGGFEGNNASILVEPAPDLADTWAWDGTDWTQIMTAHSPKPASGARSYDGRTGAAMAFDPTRGVVVLFGGESSHGTPPPPTNLCDVHVWELDATDWHEIVPGPGPSARIGAGFAYDAITHKLLLIGGQSLGVGTYLSDEWEWDGTAWSSVTPPSPGARSQFGIASDAARGAVVVFSGAAAAPDALVWEWNGSAWTNVTTVQPDLSGPYNIGTYDIVRGRAIAMRSNGDTFERSDAGWSLGGTLANGLGDFGAIQYDPVRRNTVLYRVNDPSNTGGFSETWLWNGSTWTNTSPAPQPPLRELSAMAPDRLGNIVMFGGYDASDTVTGDTWLWDGTGWTQAHPAHSPPPRSDLSLGYDPIRGVTVLFGGSDDNQVFIPDTWEWDGTDWTQMTGQQPTPRLDTSLIWQPNRGRLALISGSSYSLADVWEWDGAMWTQIDVAPRPAGRVNGVFFPTRDGSGIIMAGGTSQTAAFNDAWMLSWRGSHAEEVCAPPSDGDGDGLLGCADRDCWYVCTPECTPGVTCSPSSASCGDGTCNGLEDCHSCPSDCTCTPVCGDGICDPSETCSGDCP